MILIQVLLTAVLLFISACGIKGPPLPPIEEKPRLEAPAAAPASEAPASEAITTKKKKKKK